MNVKTVGIKLFFYHSQLDWYQENYFPRGIPDKRRTTRRGDWYKYLDFMDGQLTELPTNYGEVGGIWFDGRLGQENSELEAGQTID